MNYELSKRVVLSLFVAGMMLTACDEVSEGERIVKDETTVGNNGPLASTEVRRCVLIEDFTGQRCPNCPNATEAIKKMQQEVGGEHGGDSLIAVAIYSGPFGQLSNGNLLPLTTETGNSYYDHWGVTAQPGVRINRVGNVIYDINGYNNVLYKVWPQATTLVLKIKSAYDATTGKALITVTGSSVKAVNGLLQVWLTEDNIVATQTMPDQKANTNYVHNHVLRKSITSDIYGSPFNLAANGEISASFTIEPDAAWKVDNMAVVAFVYNDAEGVLQVTKAPLVQAEEEEEAGDTEE